MGLLAELDGVEDLSVLFWFLCLICLAGAGYMAYLRNAVAAILLVFVALAAAVIAS